MTIEEKKAIAYLKLYCTNDVLYDNTHYEQIKILLNLIENQQKEIEELKNADLTIVYMDGFYDGQNKIKDKIKAKIEELANEKEKYFEKQVIEHEINIIQSLLEEE